MNNNTTDINDIIIRYLDGSSSREEKEILLKWLKESGENMNEFSVIRDLWLSCDVALNDNYDIKEALYRLQSRIQNETTQNRLFVKINTTWFRTVACIAILLGMTYWFIANPIIIKETYIQNQLITAKGSKGKFTLPDGSTVWLNSESKLVYPGIFEKGKRVVQLEGEGYFEVKTNKAQPFIVKSGEIDVEILGTSFDISCYPWRNTIDVVLINGSVQVFSDKIPEKALLKPGQLLTYEKNDKSINVHETKAHLHIDWIKERLVFDNTKLSDIIISMEGWYGISIKCPESFAEQTRISFTIRGENIEETLKAMSYIIPITYNIMNDKVTINPR